MAYNPYAQYYPTNYQTPVQQQYQPPMQNAERLGVACNTANSQQCCRQISKNRLLMTVFIEREEDVNDYPVAAGTTVQLISFKLGKFWLKSTATNGVPQPLRTFSFTEQTPPTKIQNDGVSRAEFDALNNKLDKLLKELGGES